MEEGRREAVLLFWCLYLTFPEKSLSLAAKPILAGPPGCRHQEASASSSLPRPCRPSSTPVPPTSWSTVTEWQAYIGQRNWRPLRLQQQPCESAVGLCLFHPRHEGTPSRQASGNQYVKELFPATEDRRRSLHQPARGCPGGFNAQGNPSAFWRRRTSRPRRG